MHARGADLSSIIEPLLHDVMDIHRGDSDVLVMCARNEDRDQLLTDSICQGHPQIKVQSVASSAGATATASIVNQPVNGHLNGRPSDPFDPGSPCILDRYSSGEQTSLLCTDVRLEYQSEGRPGVILGSPCSLFSESTGLVSHMHHPVEFCHFRSAATCYGMRQSSVQSLRVEDWIMLLFGWFFPLPCLRAPGRGVPGFLAGPALVFCCCFSSMIQILSFVIFTRMSHVSQCTKGSAPIRESCTDFSPLINR